ncbi:MAG TPA: hypothetical protein VFS32_00410 [Candidatus Limnocylindrales bacterium]|nr:hypothetical protein [Candidatus Limnocylindrales bacterium]
MPEPTTLAAVLLVLGPIVGAIPVAYPPLMRVWSMPREDHVRTVAAHRTAWRFLNGGFVLATVSTAAGLGVLALAVGADDDGASILVAATVAYSVAGVLWCAVLAIRAVTTPALLDLGAVDTAPGEAERLLGGATGALFAAFVLTTGVTLVALGAGLALTGTIPAIVGSVAAGIAVVVLAAELASGDAIPAVLYLPTMLIGIAVLAGWR